MNFFRIFYQISSKFILEDLIDNKLSFVEIMASHRTSDRPLSEAVLSYVTDAYMRHSVSMILLNYISSGGNVLL